MNPRLSTSPATLGRHSLSAALLLALALSTGASDTLSLQSERIAGNGQRLQGIPGSAHTLGREALDRQDYADIHRVLREIPGVEVMEEEGYGNRPNIGIRGTSIERNGKIAVMEDGILAAPAPYAAPAAYYFPTVGRMQAVEVRKGSSQVPYGPSTTGGALNLVSTRIPQKTAGQLTLVRGEDGLSRTHAWVGGNQGLFGWLAETHQYSADGFKTLSGPADPHDNLQKTPTGFERGDQLVKLRVRAPASWSLYQELEAKVGWHGEVAHETYLGLTREDFARNPYQRYAASAADRLEVDQRQLSLRYLIQPSQALDLTLRAYRTDTHRNWYKLDKVNGTGISAILDNPLENAAALAIVRGADSDSATLEVKANNRVYQTWGVQLGSEWRFATGSVRHLVEGGVRWHQDQEERYQWTDRYAMANSRLSLGRGGTPGTADNRIAYASALAVHAQDAMTWGALTLTPGLRFENIAYQREDWGKTDPERLEAPKEVDTDLQVWVWGLGGAFALNEQHTLFAGIHRGFEPPGPGAGDSTLPEESVNMELGTRLHMGSTRLEGALFMNIYQNLLGKETAAGGGASTGELYNGGEALVFGVELSGGTDLIKMRNSSSDWGFPVRTTYTFSQGEFRSDFSSDYEPWGTVSKGDELPYLSRHRFLVGGGVAYRTWSLDVVASYVGIMRHQAGSGDIDYNQSPGDYTTVDAQVSWQAHSNLELFAGGVNLLNKEGLASRTPAGLRPIMPRTLRLGTRAHF